MKGITSLTKGFVVDYVIEGKERFGGLAIWRRKGVDMTCLSSLKNHISFEVGGESTKDQFRVTLVCGFLETQNKQKM